MRKVKVNAQVTFVIYILESVANFSILVVWVFVIGMSSEVTVTMGVVWFHIVLPYTFLMNTSHNKNLLTDDGWWNTIRNTVGIPGIFNFSTPEPILSCLDTLRSSLQVNRRQQEIGHGDVQGTTVRNSSYLQVNSRPPCKQSSSDSIFLISKPEDVQQPSFSGSSNIPGRSACTRQEVLNSRDRRMRQKLPTTKQTSATDDEDQSPQKSHHLCLGEEILCNMIIHIDNEDEYLHYLKQLSQLEENVKQGPFRVDFEIIHLSDLPTPKLGKVKHSGPKSRSGLPGELDTSGPNKKSKNNSKQMVILNVELLEQIPIRIEKRKRLLKEFQEHCSDQEKYKRFTDRIFDLEESLIS